MVGSNFNILWVHFLIQHWVEMNPAFVFFLCFYYIMKALYYWPISIHLCNLFHEVKLKWRWMTKDYILFLKQSLFIWDQWLHKAFNTTSYCCDRSINSKLDPVHLIFIKISFQSGLMWLEKKSLFVDEILLCFFWSIQFPWPTPLDCGPSVLLKVKIFAVCFSHTSNHYFKHESSHLRGNKK